MNSEQYEQFKKEHPEFNWEEAEEIQPEDLEAAAEFFDNLLTEVKGALNDGHQVSEHQSEAGRQ